jgi:hypothetical protein
VTLSRVAKETRGLIIDRDAAAVLVVDALHHAVVAIAAELSLDAVRLVLGKGCKVRRVICQ